VFASRTTRSLLGKSVKSQVQVNGSPEIIAIVFSMVEYPSARMKGPEPHGPGASIAHQCPSPVPNLL
jgi:hypothetical protein